MGCAHLRRSWNHLGGGAVVPWNLKRSYPWSLRRCDSGTWRRTGSCRCHPWLRMRTRRLRVCRRNVDMHPNPPAPCTSHQRIDCWTAGRRRTGNEAQMSRMQQMTWLRPACSPGRNNRRAPAWTMHDPRSRQRGRSQLSVQRSSWSM